MKSIVSECVEVYDSIHDRLGVLKSVLNVMEYSDVPELYPATINTITSFMLEEITAALELNIRKLFHLAVSTEDYEG